MKIAAVILAKDEDRRIGACLERLRGHVDHIIVCTDKSVDGTSEIVKSDVPKQVFVEPSGSGYAEKKNYAWSYVPGDIDWILWADVDEVFDPEFFEWAKKKATSDDSTTLICARFPRCRLPDGGDYPDYQVRFARNWPDEIEWRGEVHERLYWKPEGIPIDQLDDPKRTERFGVATLDNNPIMHLPRLKGMKRDWWNSEGASDLAELPKPAIVGCMGAYGERIAQALVGIKRLKPHIDRFVIIVDESVTAEQKNELVSAGCEVYFEKWMDSTVAMRNAYVKRAQHGDWLCVSDPDEWYGEETCRDIRKIIAEAEKEDHNLLLINSHDSTKTLDGKVNASKSDFYKNLIFRKEKGTRYVGTGFATGLDKSIQERDFGWHETLNIIKARVKQLPDEYYYEHVKEEWEVWERAARNVWTCGGGNDMRERNPEWKPLHEICESLGIKDWPQLRDYLRKGKVDIRLKDWLFKNRLDGLDYEHEMMEFGRFYFEYLHPDEKAYVVTKVDRTIEQREWKPIPADDLPDTHPVKVQRYVEEQYMKMLGRHADQLGKEHYTKQIVAGKIKKDDLPRILMQSDEYAEKTYPEALHIEIPHTISVRFSNQIAMTALMRSSYWSDFKKRFDLARFIEKFVGEKFYDEFYRKLNLGELKDLKDLMVLIEASRKNE